jgi:integrase
MVQRYVPKMRNVPRYRPSKAKDAKTDYTAFDGTVVTAKRATVFTVASVARLKLPAEGQVEFFQNLERGLSLVLRLSYGGTRAWRVVFYVGGKQRAKTIGRFPDVSVAAARKAAYAFDPKAANAAADAGSFKAVAEAWLKRYVAKKQLRSQPEIERQLREYVYPAWARVPFFEIRRKAVNALLDKIEDKHGAPTADGVLATVRAICNWYAANGDENYSSPIVRGMRRDLRPPEERERARILTDDEIRAVWRAAEGAGNFGAIVRLALLTGQRREKIATMRWDDIVEGDWVIRTAPREKGNGGRLQLVGTTLNIIEAQPRVEDNPFVFAGSLRGRRHKSAADRDEPPCFNSWSQCKAELDAKLPKAMPRWTLHDLRRTARSLLARKEAGVGREVAEHLIGHAIPGVEGVYNRYDYYDEKADALARLDVLLDQIVNPPDRTNVVSLEHREARVTSAQP